jgi:hypothetical protein
LKLAPHVRVRLANTAQKIGETTMKNTMFVAITAVVLSTAGVMEAQVNRPPTVQPRRPEPQERPAVRVQPERRAPEPEFEPRRPEPERPERAPRYVPPENHPYNNFQAEGRPGRTENRPTIVIRPTVVTPVMRHAMTYNTRHGGIHILPEYFATHYGYTHGFHLMTDLTLFGGEWYFNWNSGWFGVMGVFPGNWDLRSDYLYIDIGDDGNYYLYDAQFPGVTVQLTFVQNVGDDQAGADQDQ